ncbi:MAG: aldehyde dehydrogenase family protein [Candidatus Melainabacteria bacterium]|jgi:alpha-ketoglutaric semialdehyde dehydrogenase|nr:aldehyde dehydrogenase family protein [Candidatus Melainabacteria bacterium]
MPKIINYNPANIKEIVSEHEVSTSQELDAMLEKSTKAFKIWSVMPAPKRAQYLMKANAIFTERKEELSLALHKENGKPLEEARGEIQEIIDVFDFFNGEGRAIYGMTGQSEMPDKAIMTIRQPIGPAVFITAWNFPAAVPSWKAAPALIAGNTFILKPSELAPLSGKLFVDVLNEAGLPDGVAQVAMGAGEVGEYLAKSDHTKIVSITGSVAVGRHVAGIAAAGFKKCALELGGKNSTIVLADANQELVADGILWGAYGTGGQRCTSTSRLIIDKAISGPILEKLKTQAAKFYDKDKKQSAINYAPIISLKQLNKIHGMVQAALAEGAELVCGGEILDDGSHQGYFYAPTILKTKHGMKITKEEVFGPVLAVMEIDSTNKTQEEVLEEALAISNDVDYGLSNSIYTKDVNLGMKAVHRFESGLVYLNAPTIGAECGGASLFGGWKNTGNGSRESGVAAFETYTQYKTIAIDYSDSLQRAQID